jgi:hypothetical protein
MTETPPRGDEFTETYFRPAPRRRTTDPDLRLILACMALAASLGALVALGLLYAYDLVQLAQRALETR